MIDFYYHLNHRRLRERFQMQTILRHERRMMGGLRRRHAHALRPLPTRRGK